MKFFNQFVKSTFFRYMVAGGTASLIDIILFNSLIYISGTYYLVAVVFSNSVSFFIRFFLQKRAFRSSVKKGIRRELFLFAVFFVLTVGCTAFLMYIFVDLVHVQKSLSQIISILLVASMTFFAYRFIIFPYPKRDKSEKPKRLLIITQKVDKDDPVLGFFHRWIEEFALRYESVIVICLEKGRSEVPENVKVLSLGKEERQSRLQYLIHFYWYILTEKKNYDSVFVHMNQQYVILGGIIWKLLGKRIYMWRNHHAGSLETDIAASFCDKVFCTSKYSYTAKYKKTEFMPVGVDLVNFKPSIGVPRIPQSLLFLGRISPVKRPHLFVEAAIRLKENFPNLSASLYGDALPKDEEYYGELKEKVKEASALKYIKFYKGIPNAETVAAYSAHEIFINLSSSGMYDKTIFEAIACGALLLASNENLRGEVSDDFIFKEGDLKELTEKMQKLLRYSAEQKAAAVLELRSFSQKHSLTELTDRLLESIN